MKKEILCVSLVLLLCSVAVNGQIRKTDSFIDAKGVTWIVVYPKLCKLDTSSVKVAEEMTALISQRNLGSLFHFRSCKGVIINDKGVFMKTEYTKRKLSDETSAGEQDKVGNEDSRRKKNKKRESEEKNKYISYDVDTVIEILPAYYERNLRVLSRDRIDNGFRYIDNLGESGKDYIGINGGGIVIDYASSPVNRLCNILFTLQHNYMLKVSDRKMNNLKKLMAENKSNIVSEEQRKLIVQANGLGQQKMYEDAIAYYYKALEINSLSYPPAYFNIALLQAQNGRFDLAIMYMKYYLLLSPGATDARAAQDKIYEWELNFQYE